MYAKREFILAPTFKLYCELMDFIKHAGILDRSEEDVSPRRPLTAVRCLQRVLSAPLTKNPPSFVRLLAATATCSFHSRTRRASCRRNYVCHFKEKRIWRTESIQCRGLSGSRAVMHFRS